jgi:hypothetical protein
MNDATTTDALPSRALIVSPDRMAEAVLEGRKTEIVKPSYRAFGGEELLLVSKRKALAVVRLGEPTVRDDAALRETKDRHLLSGEALEERVERHKEWGLPPYYVWPIESVERFSRPYETDVGPGPHAVSKAVTVKLTVAEITPEALDRADKRELLMVHLRLHQVFMIGFADNDKLTADDLNREDLVNAEIFVQNELERRKLEHLVDDQLTAEAAALRARSEKRDLAMVHGSGAELGPEIKIGEVLPHFKSFKARMPFLYLVGGLANHGQTKGDIDVLVKGPLSEELRRVVEHRVGRALPPELSRRVQFVDDDLGGPFSDHVELADLVVEMRPRFERKEMREEPAIACGERVEKQADPLMALPKRAGKRDSVLQSHFRGASLHSDLRMDVGPDLIGLTLNTQKAGRVREPVDTLAEARRIDRTWKVDGSFFYKAMLAPAGVRAEAKKRQPKAWLKLEDSVFEEGSVGATRFEQGVIVVTDRPKVEWGVQDADFHEWFFTEGKKLNGILMARKLSGQDGEFWRSFVSKEFLPSILKRRAVESKRMPPDGFSWIPRTLEQVTPPEFRYWKEKGAKAREVRDALVESRYFTARNVQMVGKEFRRVESVKTYLYVNKADGDLREQLADLEHDRWSRWMRHMFANATDENFARWARQMETPYADLSEAEKDSDRKEADNTLEVLRRNEIVDACGEEETEKAGPLNERKKLIERAVAADLGTYDELIKLTNKQIEKLLAKAEKSEAITVEGRVLKLKGLKAKELPGLLETVEEAEGFSLERDNPLAKKSEQRVGLGIVLEPEQTDSQGDIYSAAAVRGAAERYKGGLGLMHRRGLKGAKVLGSYLARRAFVVDGEPVKKGTWLMLLKFTDRTLWGNVKDGDYTGLSIGGSAIKEPA